MPVDATRLPLAASRARALAARCVLHAFAGTAAAHRGVEQMRRGVWRTGGADSGPPSRFDRS